MPKVKLADAELSYTIDDFTDPWKRAPWVLLHHAPGGSMRQWYGWVPTLARHYRVLRFDMRGHGASTWPGFHGHWPLEMLVDDIRGLMDTLDIRRVHFVGAGGSGMVGLKLATTLPDRVRSLTLLDCEVRTAAALVGAAAGSKESGQGIIPWPGTSVGASLATEGSNGLDEWLAEDEARTPAAVARSCASHLADVDLTEILPRIKIKTLLLAGEQDDVESLRRRILKSELHKFPGSGQNAQVLMPDQLAARTLAFIQKVDEIEEATLSIDLNC